MRGLQATLESTRCELRRVDATVTTLLFLTAGMAAGAVALIGREWPAPAPVWLWAAMVPILAAALVLLSAVRPRLASNAAAGSWLHAAGVGPATLLESLERNNANAALVVAHDVCALARLVVVIHRRIALAVPLLVAGLALLVVALVVGTDTGNTTSAHMHTTAPEWAGGLR